MKHRLSRVPSVVNDHPVTMSLETAFLGDLLGDEEQMADHLAVRLLHAVDVRDVHFWNDQDMCRRLGVQVLEGDGEMILVHQLRRDLLCDYLAEDAVLVVRHKSPPLSKAAEKTAASTGVACRTCLLHFDQERVLIAIV